MDATKVPEVGDAYNGSVVTKVKKKEEDRGEKVRTRYTITLESGIMMIQDIYTDKVPLSAIEGDEFADARLDEIDFPKMAKGGSDKKKSTNKDAKAQKEARRKLEEEERARKQAEEEEEEEEEERIRKEREAEDARKQAEAKALEEERLRKEKELEEERQRKQQEEEEERRRIAEEKEVEERRKRQEELERQRKLEAEMEALRLKEEEDERRRLAAEAEAERQRIKDSWKPQHTMVYPEDSYDDAPDPPKKGVWKFGDGIEPPEDSKYWKPQETVVFPPDHKLPEENADLPNGVWAYKPGSQPRGDSDEWPPKRDSTIFVYAPGETPPPDVKVGGKWSIKPGALNIEWPPPVDEVKKREMTIGRWKPKNSENPWSPTAATIYPKNKYPPANLSDDLPTGQWHYQSKPHDDRLWKPLDVFLYPEGNIPRSVEAAPHGLFGVALDAEPDNEGNWDQSNLMFYPPGDEVSVMYPKVGLLALALMMQYTHSHFFSISTQ